MPTAELQALRDQFVAKQIKAALPGVNDKRARIVLYSDTHTRSNVLLAYKELRDWGYKKVSILEGGFDQWAADDRPIDIGAAPREIVYVKKLAPGAISVEEFAKLEKSRDGTVFLDVRTANEAASGVLKGAKQIPLDSLDANLGQLPKNQEIIAYCANGIRAEMAYQKLKGLGYKVRFLNEEITISADGSYKI